MTFYEKYPQLKEEAFLTEVLTETVYSTMALEDQEVPKLKVQEIVSDIVSYELKGFQFVKDQQP